MKNQASPATEWVQLAGQFARDNKQTSFLLKRMKAHDIFIYEHSLRVAYYSLLLAQGLGLSGKEQEVLYRSALLMDIGKLRVTYKVEANQDESGTPSILMHPQYSADILKPFIDRGLVDGEAVLQHHENLDGTGYPYYRTWEDITLNARILRVADSFAAATSYDKEKERSSASRPPWMSCTAGAT
ncbi:HD domain-containing protein [Paenibacillus sp. CC-CFT747]|nr:HD domain-containing protein [Paenibacillus sp. CC-CFT747]